MFRVEEFSNRRQRIDNGLVVLMPAARLGWEGVSAVTGGSGVFYFHLWKRWVVREHLEASPYVFICEDIKRSEVHASAPENAHETLKVQLLKQNTKTIMISILRCVMRNARKRWNVTFSFN